MYNNVILNFRTAIIWPTIVDVMVDARNHVIVVSFSTFVLSLLIFLINDLLQKNSVFFFQCTMSQFINSDFFFLFFLCKS